MFKSILSNNNERPKGFIVFAFVLALHGFLLYLILFHNNSFIKKNSAQTPSISFTAKIMDDAASTSEQVSQAAKTESILEIENIDAKSTENIKSESDLAEKIETASKSQKSQSDEALDLAQHSQVLAPTRKAIYDAAYLNNPPPFYPPISRRLAEQGTVTLNVFVNEEGNPTKIEIKSSSGFDRLDLAATDTVTKWRFLAAKKNNRMVASWVEIPIKFSLDKTI